MSLVQMQVIRQNYLSRLFKTRSANILGAMRSSSTTPLQLQFVSNRYSEDFKGIPHHLGLPSFNFLIHLYISQSSVVLKNVNSDSVPKPTPSGKNLPKVKELLRSSCL